MLWLKGTPFLPWRIPLLLTKMRQLPKRHLMYWGVTRNDLVRQRKTTEQHQVNTIDFTFTADYYLNIAEPFFDLHYDTTATMITYFKKGNQTHFNNDKHDNWTKNQPTVKEHLIMDDVTCCSTTKNNEQGDSLRQ